MPEEDYFKEKFSEMVNSDDLKKISEEFAAETTFGTKELLLIAQSLSDAVSNITGVLIERASDQFDFVFSGDNIYHNLLCTLYKISEDFNECMIEYYEVFEDDDDDDDDDGEDESDE